MLHIVIKSFLPIQDVTESLLSASMLSDLQSIIQKVEDETKVSIIVHYNKIALFRWRSVLRKISNSYRSWRCWRALKDCINLKRFYLVQEQFIEMRLKVSAYQDGWRGEQSIIRQFLHTPLKWNVNHLFCFILYQVPATFSKQVQHIFHHCDWVILCVCLVPRLCLLPERWSNQRSAQLSDDERWWLPCDVFLMHIVSLVWTALFPYREKMSPTQFVVINNNQLSVIHRTK